MNDADPKWWENWWADPQLRTTCIICEGPVVPTEDLYGRCPECRDGLEVKVALRPGDTMKAATDRGDIDRRHLRSCKVCGKRGASTCEGQCTRAAALRHCFNRRIVMEYVGETTYDSRGLHVLKEDVAQYEAQADQFRRRATPRGGHRGT